MQFLPLDFTTEVEVSLKIRKNESGVVSASLFVDDFEINHGRILEFQNSGFPLGTHEGETLSCKLNKHVLFYNGDQIAKYDSLFDSGKILSLAFSKKVGMAKVGIVTDKGKYSLSPWISLKDLPKGLFDRRNHFPVSVVNDSEWMIVRYANLHQHTEYSLLDGITRIKDLAKKSEDYCAITDHGNMFGFNEFRKAMEKEGKHPIIGCEVYMETPGNTPRRVLNIEAGEENIDDTMFNNEKAPVSTLAGEHLILLAENDTGLKNLFHIVTESSEHVYRKPHVTWEILEKYHEGLIATSACIAGCVGRSVKEILKCEKYPGAADSKIVKEDNERILNAYLDKMQTLFDKDHFFIELQNHHFPLETEIMNRIREIAKSRRIRTTVGIDAHYLNKEDAEIHEYWLCMQTKKTISSPDRMRSSGDGYWVHTSDEVVELFPDDPDAMDTTLNIAERCRYSHEKPEHHMPKFPLPDGFNNEAEYLRYLSNAGLSGMMQAMNASSETKKKYQERLDYELKIIETLGWPGYFLVVSDFIAYARDTRVPEHLDRYFPAEYFDRSKLPPEIVGKTDEIYVGSGRGSAAGSLVCCTLGITQVDPLKYNLLFERFLNPDRISMPDIDTDFEDAGRYRIVEYCRAKYGADHVSGIITFTTAAARNAIRSIVRVLGLPPKEGDRLAGLVPEGPHVTIKSALADVPEFRTLYDTDPRAAKIIDLARRIEGLKMNKSLHACGKLICDAAVTEYMPQTKMPDKKTGKLEWTTELQGPECEEMGCLKMDFLGLRTLGLAHDCISMIQQDTGKVLDYSRIPLDDTNTYDFLEASHYNTSGVFQAESELFTRTVTGALGDLHEKENAIEALPIEKQEEARKELGFEMFMRVSDVNALVRPGPNQYVSTYNERILDPSKTTYDHPSMEQQLKSTFGIMLYQEQVMLLTRDMAGFSGGQMDTVRKAMGKKKKAILDEYRNCFIYGSKEKGIKGCIANGIDEETAAKVWADMEQFAGYAFNKSHAVAYSMHTVRTAWLSRYYPEEFMAATLNSYSNKADRIKLYIASCRQKGIKILPPSVNLSHEKFTPLPDKHAILFGLEGLRYVGTCSAEILEERKNGPFLNLSDFLVRMSDRKLNKRVLESLIYSGALDEFTGSFGKISRQAKIEAVPAMVKFMQKARKIKEKSQEPSLFDMGAIGFSFNETLPEFSEDELLEKEAEYLGFYATAHPLDKYDKYRKNTAFIASLLEEDEDEDGEEETGTFRSARTDYADVLGIIRDVIPRYTKAEKKKFYTFLIEDQTAEMKCVVFPSRTKKENANPIISDLESGVLHNGSVVFMRVKLRRDDFGITGSPTNVVRIESYEHMLAARHMYIQMSPDRGTKKSYEFLSHVFLKKNASSVPVPAASAGPAQADPAQTDPVQADPAYSVPDVMVYLIDHYGSVRKPRNALRVDLGQYIDLEGFFGQDNIYVEYPGIVPDESEESVFGTTDSGKERA